MADCQSAPFTHYFGLYRSVVAHRLEAVVVSIIAALTIPPEAVEQIIARAQALAADQARFTPLGVLSDEAIKEKQERLAILFRDGLYDYDRYVKERDALQTARRRMAPRRVRYDWDAMRSLLRDLPTLVTLMHTDEVRETIHALFDIVWIKDQNVVALTPAAGLRPLIEAALEYTGSNIELRSADESDR